MYRMLENQKLLTVKNSDFLDSDETDSDYEDIPDDQVLDAEQLKGINEIVDLDNFAGIAATDSIKDAGVSFLEKGGYVLTEIQRQSFIDGVKKDLVKSDDDNGECVYRSILNALVYKKVGATKLDKDMDDRTVRTLVGEEIYDIIVQYKEPLKYARQKDVIKYLMEMNEKLKDVSVCINLFLLKLKERYLFSNWNKLFGKLRSSKVKKIPVALVQTLLMGASRTKTFIEIKNKTVKDTVINLVGIPSKVGGVEIDVSYIKDVNNLFRIIRHYRGKKVMEKAFICDQCMVIQYDKPCFQKHVVNCIGGNNTRYTFSNQKVIDYHTELTKCMVQPFTIYYDLETTCGQKDNEPMRTITYAIGLSFSAEIRETSAELTNSYIYRAFNQTSAQLSTFNLPECITRFIDRTDMILLKNSIKDVRAKVKNSMERHCTLEISLIIKWTRLMLQKVLIPMYRVLSNEDVEYFKGCNEVKDCCICKTAITKKTDFSPPNMELVKLAHKSEYMRLYGAVGIFNMAEEEYEARCNKVVQNVSILSDIDGIARSTWGGKMLMVKVSFPKVYDYMQEVDVDSIAALKSLVFEEYKRGIAGDDATAFIMRTVKEKKKDKEKVDKYTWSEGLIEFEYKRLVDIGKGPSDVWIAEIGEALEETVVVHHDHFSGHIYGFAHKNCNSKLKVIVDKIPIRIYAHNAAKFDTALLAKGMRVSDWKDDRCVVNGTPNCIRSITLSGVNRFDDTLRFFEESLDTLNSSANDKEKEWIREDVKSVLVSSQMADRYGKLSDKEKEEVLDILSQKGAIPYDMFNTGYELEYTYLPQRLSFASALKQSAVDEVVYCRMERLWNLMKLNDVGELVCLYNFCDVIILTCLAQNRFEDFQNLTGLCPKHYSSTCTVSKAAMLMETKIVLTPAPDFKTLKIFERALFGGYCSMPFRLSFNTGIITDNGLNISLPKENGECAVKKVYSSILKG